MNVSGLYERQANNDVPFSRENLRLDVDGTFPQMAASGTGSSGLQFSAHWVARPLTQTITLDGEEWSGPIVQKFGNVNLMPYDFISIRVENGQLRATFQRTGFPDRVKDFNFKSPHFREVTFEYDAEEGVDLLLEYETHSHVDRPATLANETLSIDNVFERAGFDVLRTGQDSIVPNAGSGTNERWSSNEMHDAMQVHFSRFAALPLSQQNQPRWALWTFFAKLYEDGPSTGGIMFDTIGSAHRQGTAIFRNSFISNAPFGETTVDAWRQRMAFWTAVHEMGHAFNLLHAWQKTLGTPWIPQPSGYDLLTFMNYPYLYKTGTFSEANTIRFFKDFDFRFTDDELLFLRHAPERYVIMGGANFGTNHALEQARLSPVPAFALELRVNRETPEFEFMEPVVIEMKLTNTTSQPTLIEEHLLRMNDSMTILVRKRGEEAKAFHPFAHYCYQPNLIVLEPGQSVYESLFLSVDHHEWLIDSPGYYSIQVCLQLRDEDILSNAFQVRVAPPVNRDQEYLAQDYFSEDVGRVITFDGTLVLTKAHDTLQEVSARFPKSNAAIHANVALHMPRAAPYKLLVASGEDKDCRYEIKEIDARKADTQALVKLLGDPKTADETARFLGHIEYGYYAERVSDALKMQDEMEDAHAVTQCMHDTLESRGVPENILAEITETITDEPTTEKKPRKRKPK
ncbi:MAG: hypothetical protein R3B84_13440 [Zavarzinella sp.]